MNTTAPKPCKALSGNGTEPAAHLYVHVPFCATLCHYCAFYSEPSKGETINRYLDALEKELASWAPHLKPETIFFGGGTPTLLNLRQLERLLSNLQSRIPTLSPQSPVLSPEFTFESNPATVSLDKARLLRSFGVNRISMGVQSFDERILDKLGRIHSVEQALKSYEVLREAGFDNVNIDLMFALPGQSMTDWEKTLRQAIALQPEHISTYCLTLEEDTVFWKLFQEGAIKPNEDEETDMYQRTWDILENAGYFQYEISNFARCQTNSLSPQSSVLSPFRCGHNIGYWRCEDCIGLGPSAASNRGNKRWKNIANTEEYIARISRGESPSDFEESLDDATRAGEYIAFGLRMMEGVSATEFEKRFGGEQGALSSAWTGRLLTETWTDELKTLQSEGLVTWNGDRLRLTPRGKLFADEVSSYFVSTTV